MIHFYGSPMSSAGRTHVMLEEIGVPYEYHRVDLRDPAQRASYLEVNPGGKVPFLVDEGLRLPESIAIDFYLAERYAPQLWASSLDERALIYAWSLWAIATLQPEVMRVLHHTLLVPQEHRSNYELEHGKRNAQRYLDHLESQLPSTGFLVGGRFTVADLHVASVVNLASALAAAKPGPVSNAWMDAIKARPAWQRVAAAG